MGFEASQGRPLARLAARGRILGAPIPQPAHSAYAPPINPARDGLEHVPDDADALGRRILRGMLLGEDLTPIRSQLAPDLVAWSPSLFATSRDLLLVTIATGELDGSGFGEVSLEVTGVVAAASVACSEWRFTARFTGPEFIDDDLMIEPTGHLVETAGALVVGYHQGRIVSIHCYYDSLALLEQLLTSR